MRTTVDGVVVYYPGKLDSRRKEVLEFARYMIAEFKIKKGDDCRMVKIWESKRHDLVAKAVIDMKMYVRIVEAQHESKI